MPLALGVKFRHHGPLNYYAPLEEEELLPGVRVVVAMARGEEIAEVVMEATEMDQRMVPSPLPPVVRRASAEDLEQRARVDSRLPEVMRQARELVDRHQLQVKVSRAEISFDETRILFDFTSDRPTDFQNMAKELASHLRCRVELRRIGARDEAKEKDGYGPCGRRLCCSSWLKEFVPVTIKMAKEQGLPLNPSRLNGMCGKLKCCLQYENEQYVDLKRRLPLPGSALQVEGQDATVTEISVAREQVLVTLTESGTVLAVPAAPLLQEPRPATAHQGRRRPRPRDSDGT